MKTFYLVRHAQYANPDNVLVGRLPVELSPDGRMEAQQLADYFANKNIVQIYSSPVMRCKQTSKVIAQNNIPLKFDLRLAETLSAYQGYKGKELDWNHFYAHQVELGGEDPTDVQRRIVEFWEEIKDKREGDVIICSHGDPLYLLYAHLAKITTPDIKEIYELPDREYQPKASVRKVTYNKGKIEIEPITRVKSL